MNSKEYRVIDAKNKLESKDFDILDKGLQGLKEEVKPKSYQAVAFNGNVIFEAEYHPDAILSYKVPRIKTNYNFEKFPEQLQHEIQKLQEELELTKVQIKEILKNYTVLNLKVTGIDRQIQFITNTANTIKKESDKEREIKKFNKRYSAFNECLTGQLHTFDTETKNQIVIKLNNLVQIIDDIVKSYLT